MARFYDNRSPDSLASKLRAKRQAIFIQYLKKTFSKKSIDLIDVGGTLEYWLHMYPLFGEHGLDVTVTILNLPPLEEKVHLDGKVRTMRGDATNMAAIRDKQFDVAFSNSVIEHVGTYYMQFAFAREVLRISRHFFVQTPNKYFVIEPHFIFPFWFLVPKTIKCFLLSYVGLGWHQRKNDIHVAKAEVEQVRLMTFSELQYVFPRATILREKIWILTKSFIAMGESKQ